MLTTNATKGWHKGDVDISGQNDHGHDNGARWQRERSCSDDDSTVESTMELVQKPNDGEIPVIAGKFPYMLGNYCKETINCFGKCSSTCLRKNIH